MQERIQTARQLLDLFLRRLVPVYGKGEVLQFVYRLAEHRLGWSKVQLHAEPLRKIPSGIGKLLLDDLEALERHRPIQYIIGIGDFYGRQFEVTEDVLIPRPETEELAGLAIAAMKSRTESTAQRVLDIGTGSGCIALTIKLECPETGVTAIDNSMPALLVAKRNAARYGCDIALHEADLFSDTQLFPLGKFDLIISNPPYVTREDALLMNPNVVGYEPWQALFPGEQDPLRYYRRIAAVAPRLATPRAEILMEINEKSGEQVGNLFRAAGFREVTVIRDLFGKDRFVRAADARVG